jgi:hypothetical protein
MSVSLPRLIRASMGSFPAMFAAPSQNREYPDTFLHSVEVVTCTYKRSNPCCTTGRSFSSTLPWCGTQSMIQANHCSFPRPCIPTLLQLQLRFATHAGCPTLWYLPTLVYLSSPGTLLFGSILTSTICYPRRSSYTLVISDLGNLPCCCHNPS